MPVELDRFFNDVQVYAESQQFHIDADVMEPGTGLHGIKKLSSSEKAAENKATVQAFIQSLEQDPRYAAMLERVRAPLEELMNSGKPLTAGVVKQARLELDFFRGVELGRQLAQDGRIPAGHGSSFGQFVALRMMPMDTPAEQTAAVREYLLQEVLPGNRDSLISIPDMGEKQKAAARLLAACDRERDWLPQMLDRELAGGLDQFSFNDFTSSAYARFHEDRLNVMRELEPASLETLAGLSRNAEILTFLAEVRPFLDDGDMTMLLQHISTSEARVDTPAHRMEVMREFMLNRLGSESVRGVMTAHHLPEGFSTAIGHNPQVVAEARAMLDALGTDAFPAKDQVRDMLRTAAEAFVTAHEQDMKAFVEMAKNPPVKLTPPLTLEKMSVYLNAMFTGDMILEPLLNDDAPVDAAFLQKLIDHAEALQSSAHSVHGDFGADDMNAVLNNSIRLLLVRRGVPQQMLPELVTRAISRFGRLASELTSVSEAAGSGRQVQAFVLQCLAMYRILERHAAVLIGLLNDEQRANMKLDCFSISDADDAATKKAKANQCTTFKEATFEKAVSPDKLSPMVRDFARAKGVSLPDAAPLSTEKVKKAADAILEADNNKMRNTILDNFIPSTGMSVVHAGGEFRAFFEEVSAANDFSVIDLNRLNLVPLSAAVSKITGDIAVEATTAGKSVSPDEIRRAMQEKVTQQLKELKAALMAVDAFPEKTAEGANPAGFTQKEKTIIKNMVHRFGLYDPEVIRNLATAARSESFQRALHNLAAPSLTAAQLSEETYRLVSAYLGVSKAFPANVQDALPLMLSLAMALGGMTPQERENLIATLNSDMAMKVGSGFLWASVSIDLSPQAYGECATAGAFLAALREQAMVEQNGNEVHEPLYFAQNPSHITDLPLGMNGMIPLLARIAGRTFPNMYQIFAQRNPPLSRDDWDILSEVYAWASQLVDDVHLQDVLAGILVGSADEIIAAIRDHDNTMPSVAQFWNIVTGGALGALPQDVSGENAMGKMLQHLDRSYQQRLHAAAPGRPMENLAERFSINVGLGVPVRKMFELTQPGASLTKDDIKVSLEMSSLRGIDASSGYGLVNDFRHLNPMSVLSFTRADGSSLEQHPVPISAEEDNARHPAIRGMVEFMRGMTHSEAQLMRVAQAFTQASRVILRAYGQMFPGVSLDGDGIFQMHATENADGSVTVEVTSDSGQPLQAHQSFLIMPDGSYTCTDFDISRPVVSG